MRELPDLSDMVVQPGDPVAPDSLNQVSRYADVYRDQFGLEHRVDDFEHGPLAPVAFGYFRWDGSKYQAIGPTHNIVEVKPLGPGDVEVVLHPASGTVDGWFPVVAPRSADGKGYVFWWEYDDGAPRAFRCRLRFIHPDFSSSSPEDWTYEDADTDFLFQAFMHRRAVGPAGNGEGSVPEGRGVSHRIAVDGVESARHRQALVDFCVQHRERWAKEHDAQGRHLPPRCPIAAWQIRRPEFGAEVGKIQWKAGALEELEWERRGLGIIIKWRTLPGHPWRGLVHSLRYADHVAPLRLLEALTLMTLGEWGAGSLLEVGQLRPMGQPSRPTYLVHTDEKVWSAIVSIGCVLTGT